MSIKGVVKLPISNILRDGDYTCVMEVGANNVNVNLILDTGSSVFAIHSDRYNPTKDSDAKLTKLAQTITYHSGSWSGAVINTRIQPDKNHPQASLKSVPLSVVYAEQDNIFGNADGILGLAYQTLDNAVLMPETTWPQHYTKEQLAKGETHSITPYFTQLETENSIANKFAFVTQRSRISYASKDPKTDPLNWGYFIMGECEQCTDLYSSHFETINVLHDKFYNTHLKSIQLGDASPIKIPPMAWSNQPNSNSIIDSGTNSILLSPDIFEKVVLSLPSHNNQNWGSTLQLGVAMMNEIDIKSWPTLTFLFDGPDGDVSLMVKPETYWQENNPAAGIAKCVLKSTQGPEMNILGLPLFNNYFTLFDRSAGNGLGVIRFATLSNELTFPDLNDGKKTR